MIRLGDLVDATGGRVIGTIDAGATFQGFAHDSRNVRGGELFVALRTARADGHDHVTGAVEAGAAAAIVDRDTGDLDALGVPVVVVGDVRTTLRVWAARHLARLAPRVVAVTGSMGKTTTCAAICAVLGHLGDPAAIFGNANRNDLLGLPLAIGDLTPSHRVAILEVATDGAGEIAALSDLCRPEVAVVIGVAPAVEPFGGAGDAIAEYLAVARGARHLVTNADDLRLDAEVEARSRTGALAAGLTRTGTRAGADVRAARVEARPGGLRLEIAVGAVSGAVTVPLQGAHWVTAALAAVAVAVELGHAPGDAIAALTSVRPVAGRLETLAGRHAATLLDDTFSATVPSTRAALDALDMYKRPRLVILGEVGGHRAPGTDEVAHLGSQVAAITDAIVAVGDGADAIARAARGAGLDPARIATAHRLADAAARAAEWVGPAGIGEARATWTVLVKGNARARLETVVARLLEDPDEGPDRLVRQDPGARRLVHAGRDRPAWLEIDHDAIAANVRAMRDLAAPAAVMAVLKADAYGHGAVRVARTALHHGATALATAILSEAAELRAAGIGAPILVLGAVPPWQAREAARLGVAVTVFDDRVARHLSDAAVALGQTVPVHVKVDTGLRRLGIEASDVAPFGRRLAALPGLHVEGLYTHLATADEADLGFARAQLHRFTDAVASWCAVGLPRPRWVHAANSAAALRLPESRLDLVRPGIAVYGIPPGPEAPLPPGFRPAMRLKTRVVQVKRVAAGESVSYGREWVAPSDATVGVLPIGYGDGMRRGPRTWGDALVRGRRVPIIGRVCMDMCMIDLSGVPGARGGDEVVLIGHQGREAIRAEDVAARAGTTAYEVTTQILARVPREVVTIDDDD